MTIGYGRNDPSGHGHYNLRGEDQKKQQTAQCLLPVLLFESKVIFLFEF